MSKGIVLCIDNDETCLMVRELILRCAGYDVVTANSGSAGLDLFANTAVDAVILDYSMTGLNGADVASVMRRLKPGVPIVLLSGEYLSSDLHGKVDSCMSKTGDPGKLLLQIEELVNLKRSHDQRKAQSA